MSLIFALYKVFFNSYRYHIFRSLLVIIALLVAAAGLSSVLLLNASAKDTYAKATQPLMQNVHYIIKAKSGSILTKQDYALLRKQGHTNLVASTRKTVELNYSDKSQYVEIIGLDLVSLMNLTNGLTTIFASATQSISLEMLNNNMLIHPDFARELDIDPLRIPTLYSKSGIRFPDLKILDATGMGRQLVADISVVQAMFHTKVISHILVVADSTGDEIKQLGQSLPKHLTLQLLTTGDSAAQLTDSFHLNLLAMGLLMFVVCMFVVMNALQLLLSKRIANLKVLRQLGVTRGQLIKCLIIEVLFLCFVTATAGSILGMEMASLVSPAVNQTLESLYGVHIGYERVSLFGVLSTCIVANIIGGLIALTPAFIQINQRLSDISGTLVLSANSTAAKPSRIKQIGLMVLAVISVLVLLKVFADKSLSMVWDFFSIALIIFSGCGLMLQILPLILRKLLPLFKKIGPISHWGIADAVRVSSKSKIAFCAFFVAVTANIGMNLMVDSFRSATDHWITSRLHADAYISTNQSADIEKYLTQEFANIELFIRHNELATIIQLDCNPNKSCVEQKLQIRSYPIGKDHQRAMLFDSAKNDVWSDFAGNSAVLINQQFAFSQNLKLNDRINVRRITGEYLSLPISGIYLDYGNPHPQILLPPSQFKTNMDNSESRIVAVFLPNNLSLSSLEEAIAEQFPDTNIIAKEQLLSLSMQTFEKTFAITNSLNIVTFLVAAFSLASSILVIDIDNRPQRGLMRSLGITSRQLFKVSLFQYSGLSLFVCLLAVPFGILLSWILINLVNVKAFFWSYPLEFNLANIAILIGSSLLIILLMVILPLIKSAYRAPMEDVKWLQN